jgi:hypothetical protein
VSETDWFPPHIKPIRRGAYRVMCPLKDEAFWSWWDGEKWGYKMVNQKNADFYKGSKSQTQDMKWKGLLKKM